MTSFPPKLTPLIVNRSDDINVAQEACLWLKANLAYLTGALAVLLAGVILARLLSKRADLGLTSNTRVKPTVAKFLSNIIRYALWAVDGFVGTEAYTKFLLRGDIIE